MKKSLLAFAIATAFLSSGCSTMGNLATSVGNSLQGYGQKNQDSFLGKSANFAGGVYKSAGAAVSGQPNKDNKEDAKK